MVAVPVFHDEDTRNKWETKVWNAMGEFPEYKRTGKMVQRVLGEFGALANPSSFHHPVIQQLRHKVKKYISGPLLKQYFLSPRKELEKNAFGL